MSTIPADGPHFPRTAPIDAYGNGGFRFAGLSHRGSLLLLPSGIWAWPIAAPGDIDEAALATIFAEAAGIEFFILGTGPDMWVMPERLRALFREHRIGLEAMPTSSAVRTWNIVIGEGRRAAAGLIAV
jgi:uncharacterized protein